MNTFSTHAVDLMASSAAPCGLASEVAVSPYVVAQPGYAVVVEALEEKMLYNEVECADGVFRTIQTGDVMVGVLGERQALKGYSGRVPRNVRAGDVLNVLNLGGIIGDCTSELPDLGPALRVKVLGAAMVPNADSANDPWVHARIQDGALKPVHSLEASAPLVMMSGTAMDTGKTLAACQIIKGLTDLGYRVAAAKLTGASLMRDTRRMESHGAVATASFTDAGVICSTTADTVPIAKGIIAHLNRVAEPDVIVLELGAGFIGYYGVDEILVDRQIHLQTAAHVVAASDLAGVWAAEQIFRDRYHTSIATITGPVTDNDVGCSYVQNRIGIAAINAQQNPKPLAARVDRALREAAARAALPDRTVAASGT